MEYCGEACHCDRVIVYPSLTSRVPLAVLCGADVPPPVTSPTSELRVVLETDFSTADRGFLARITQVGAISTVYKR